MGPFSRTNCVTWTATKLNTANSGASSKKIVRSEPVLLQNAYKAPRNRSVNPKNATNVGKVSMLV